MSLNITKYVLPVVVGAMSGMILIVLGRNMVFSAYPLLPGTDKYDADSLAKGMSQLPDKAYMLLLVSNSICSLLAGGISALVAGRVMLRPTLIVGFVLMMAGLYDLLNLHEPRWYSLVNLLVYMPFAYIGYLAVRKRPA